MNKELKDFLRAADKALENLTQKIADKLIEDCPEDYNPQWCSYGSFNNGAGWSECGGEYEYDEDIAYQDALERIADDIEYENFEYIDDLLEYDEFRKTLANLIRSR